MGRVTPDPRPFVRVRSKDLRYLKHSGKQRSKEGGTGQGLPGLLGHRPGPRHASLAQALPAPDTDRWFPALFLFPGRKKAGGSETRTHGGKEKREFGCGPLTLRARPSPFPPQFEVRQDCDCRVEASSRTGPSRGHGHAHRARLPASGTFSAHSKFAAG